MFLFTNVVIVCVCYVSYIDEASVMQIMYVYSRGLSAMALKHVVWDNHAILELYGEELFHLKLTIWLTKNPIYRIVTKCVKFL